MQIGCILNVEQCLERKVFEAVSGVGYMIISQLGNRFPLGFTS